jgi:hypothetical protein
LRHHITFSLRHIPTSIILDHARKNSNMTIPQKFLNYNWIYLSNYYSSPIVQKGLATKILKETLTNIKTPYILCCEPILGTDYRSITSTNCELSSEQRYNSLCEYYRKKFNLYNEIQTRTTLKTEIIGHGTIWSDLERKFMWNIMQ